MATVIGLLAVLLSVVILALGLVSLIRPLRPLTGSRKIAWLWIAGSGVLFVVSVLTFDPSGIPEDAAVPGSERASEPVPVAEGPQSFTILSVPAERVYMADLTSKSGIIEVGLILNDDGTSTILARAYVAPEDMEVMVDQGLEAARLIVNWCGAEGAAECKTSKDAYVWIDRVGNERGSLGFLFNPEDWSRRSASPEDVAERAELMPGDQFGREGLGVWCNIRREVPERFCLQVRKLGSPPT